MNKKWTIPLDAGVMLFLMAYCPQVLWTIWGLLVLGYLIGTMAWKMGWLKIDMSK